MKKPVSTDDRKKTEALARLNAAAPDLLAALENLLKYGDYAETRSAAETAILKARGE